MNVITLGEIMATKVGSIDPAQHQTETFELFSIPAFDVGRPDHALGLDIGSTKKKVLPNDVLLSRIVPHIRRSWVVGPVNGLRQIASGEWIIFRGDHVHPSYLRHFLLSDVFHTQFMMTVAGVGGSLLRARPDSVARITLPLPSIPEQKRIAAILDKGDLLRQQSSKVETVREHLRNSLFLDAMADDWVEAVELGDLARVDWGDTSATKSIYVAAGYTAFSAAGPDGFVENYDFDEEGIVLSAIGARCGKCFPARGKWKAIKNTITITAIDQSRIKPSVLFRMINRDASFWGSHGGAQPFVTLGKARKIRLSIPRPRAQQIFEDAITKLEGSDMRFKIRSDEMVRLFNSLQHRAFRGEL